MITYAAALACVIALTVGQLLFKAGAIGLREYGTFFAFKPAAALVTAMCLYGITSLGWVWVLQRIELGRIYPLMALAFVLVPFASHLVFGERYHPQYFVGVAFIMLGIVIAVRA
jgi:drug/metabolite transporter (DMT)-like permease